MISILIENTQFRNPVSKSLDILVSIAFSVFIWKRDDYKFSPTEVIFITSVGTIGVFLLSNKSSLSKGFLLAPACIYVYTVIKSFNTREKFKRITIVIVLSFISFPIFNLLQSRHLNQQTLIAYKFSEKFPWYLSNFLAFSERFDQFARVTDSFFAGIGVLGGLKSWLFFIIRNLAWNPSSGRNELSFGQNWNLFVTNRSILGANLSNVALAQGMIAEGFIWNGYYSLIIECLLMSVITIWIGKLLERGPKSLFFAFGVISNMSIFEVGLVSLSAYISSALKIFLFLFIVEVIFKQKITNRFFQN